MHLFLSPIDDDGDYTPVTRTVTFPAGTTEQSVFVTTQDDDVTELTENFGAELSNPDGSGLPFNLGDQDTATADIMDMDSNLKLFLQEMVVM